MATNELLSRLADAYVENVLARRASKPKAIHERCRECGLKIRRPGHKEGKSHLDRAGRK